MSAAWGAIRTLMALKKRIKYERLQRRSGREGIERDGRQMERKAMNLRLTGIRRSVKQTFHKTKGVQNLRKKV